MPGSSTVGNFIPSSNVWDVNEIYNTEVTSPEFKELLVRLYQNLNRMSIAINTRENGTYTTNEIITGQQFFPNPTLNSNSSITPAQRQEYRKVINFGALPAGGAPTKIVPHNITMTTGFTITDCYGRSTNPANAAITNPPTMYFVPIPYISSNGVNIIELYVDQTNIYISTSGTSSFAGSPAWNTFTITYIILKYLKH